MCWREVQLHSTALPQCLKGMTHGTAPSPLTRLSSPCPLTLISWRSDILINLTVPWLKEKWRLGHGLKEGLPIYRICQNVNFRYPLLYRTAWGSNKHLGQAGSTGEEGSSPVRSSWVCTGWNLQLSSSKAPAVPCAGESGINLSYRSLDHSQRSLQPELLCEVKSADWIWLIGFCFTDSHHSHILSICIEAQKNRKLEKEIQNFEISR